MVIRVAKGAWLLRWGAAVKLPKREREFADEQASASK